MVHLKTGVNRSRKSDLVTHPLPANATPGSHIQVLTETFFFLNFSTAFGIDVHLLRFPRPGLSDPEPRTRMRANPKPDVNGHRGDLVPVAARTRIRTLHAGHLPNRGAAHGRPALTPCARGIVVHTTREP
jgi:hypothetical protein